MFPVGAGPDRRKNVKRVPLGGVGGAAGTAYRILLFLGQLVKPLWIVA